MIVIDKYTMLTVDPGQISSMRIDAAYGQNTVLHVHMCNGDRHQVKHNTQSRHTEDHVDVYVIHARLLAASKPPEPVVLQMDERAEEDFVRHLLDTPKAREIVRKIMDEPLPPKGR